MPEIVDRLRKDKACRLGMKVFLIILLFDFAFLIFKYFNLPPQIPLYYSRPWGEDQLARPEALFLLPLGILLAALVNFGMALFLFEEFPFLARILVGSTILIFLLISISLLKIVSLVT
jgi:hypothetical protein